MTWLLTQSTNCRIRGSELVENLHLDDRFCIAFTTELQWSSSQHASRQRLWDSCIAAGCLQSNRLCLKGCIQGNLSIILTAEYWLPAARQMCMKNTSRKVRQIANVPRHMQSAGTRKQKLKTPILWGATLDVGHSP